MATYIACTNDTLNAMAHLIEAGDAVKAWDIWTRRVSRGWSEAYGKSKLRLHGCDRQWVDGNVGDDLGYGAVKWHEAFVRQWTGDTSEMIELCGLAGELRKDKRMGGDGDIFIVRKWLYVGEDGKRHYMDCNDIRVTVRYSLWRHGSGWQPHDYPEQEVDIPRSALELDDDKLLAAMASAHICQHDGDELYAAPGLCYDLRWGRGKTAGQRSIDTHCREELRNEME